MKVKDLIAVLEGSDPEALVVVNLAFAGGLTQITTAERHVTGGFDGFMSWDRVPVVELSNGQAAYMRSQGRDVEGDGVPRIRDESVHPQVKLLQDELVEERRSAVAWLRQHCVGPDGQFRLGSRDNAMYAGLANCIERGEHRSPTATSTPRLPWYQPNLDKEG